MGIGINALVSRQTWHITKDSGFYELYAKRLNVLIDSGAFVEFVDKRKKVWSVEQYHEWLDATLDTLDNWNVKVNGYMTLDAIGDRYGTRENYEKSLAAGYKPIPVLTLGYDEDDFKFYTSTSKRIAVGSIAAMNLEALQHLARAMDKLRHTDLEVHLLGIDKHKLIKRYRPASIDTTSWSHITRSGRAKYMRNINTLEPLKRIARLSGDVELNAQLRMALRKAGFDPTIVAKNRRWIKDVQSHVFECYFLSHYRRYAHLVEERYGTKYYFALVTNRMLNIILMQLGSLVGDPLPCLGMAPGDRQSVKWIKSYQSDTKDHIVPPDTHVCKHV